MIASMTDFYFFNSSSESHLLLTPDAITNVGHFICSAKKRVIRPPEKKKSRFEPLHVRWYEKGFV